MSCGEIAGFLIRLLLRYRICRKQVFPAFRSNFCQFFLRCGVFEIDVVGLADLAPGKTVTVVIRHSNGQTEQVPTVHTMSEEHIHWFRAGSALNVLRAQTS